MNDNEREILIRGGVSLDDAVHRFGGNEKVYISCLSEFLLDDSMVLFRQSIADDEWDNACAAAHTLKGLAGNMGFDALMNAAAKIVEHIRAGSNDKAKEVTNELERCYGEIVDTIQHFMANTSAGE